jgi:hypothetical protein
MKGMCNKRRAELTEAVARRPEQCKFYHGAA